MYELAQAQNDFKPVNFNPIVIKNFVDPDLIRLLQHQCTSLALAPDTPRDDKIFNRKQVHNDPIMSVVHLMIIERTEEFLKRKLKPSYNFTSLYFEGAGACPKHTDRPPCRYTVDLCINQKKPWPLFAVGEDGKEYKSELEIGDAMILSGTNHEHWREPMQGEDNFCHLVFFHFVDLDYVGGLN